VIPIALGGATTVDNLQLLCGPGNRLNGADL
jgi:5-methylcytosine-specific restriction endonuclease McrA